MAFPVHLGGPAQYRLRIARELCQAATEIPIRRLLQGPRRPTWGWLLELGTEVLKKHLATAFAMADVDEARRYLDAFVLDYPAESRVEIDPEVQKTFRGDWFTPQQPKANRSILYFHGGGYSFYPKAYSGFIALIASTTQCRTFALDYRLSPEYRFPSQLEDALTAYRWLLRTGCRPEDVALVGDSAGGHLALTLLLSLRDSKMPMPACAAVLSPATDFLTEYPSITTNEPFDWINYRMITRWAGWFCDDVKRCDVLVSPVQADLRGLPPIYIQAGEAEILFDSIQAFAERGRKQGIDIELESWRDMNHVFQMFGPDVPQSAKALRRLADVIDLRLHASQKAETLFNASS
jgi:epsilon-lactone hydrolase